MNAVNESCDKPLPDAVYTVEDVVERMGFGWYQLGITLFSGSLWVSRVKHMIIGIPAWYIHT